MVKKIENRNIDVTKARGELEEDLLEYVYRTWRQGRQITSKEYAREVNITDMKRQVWCESGEKRIFV
ncbi:MAG: hypothetical protein V8R13_08090 [Coprococcus sp.]